MDEQINEIISKIPRLEQGKRVILGIDGLSRSGKTTFVNKLIDVLKVKKIPFYVFHIDDHIVERKQRYHTGHEKWFEYYQLQWDVKGLKNLLFDQLEGTHSFSLSFYQDESDTQIIKKVTLPNPCVVIIEGVFLQRKEWRAYFNFLAYLDCPREKRFQRESKETMKNVAKFENRYWKAEEYYLETERPIERANMVIYS